MMSFAQVRFCDIVARGCAVSIVDDVIYGSTPEFLAGVILWDGRTVEQHYEEWEALGTRVINEIDRQTGPVADWLPGLFNHQR